MALSRLGADMAYSLGKGFALLNIGVAMTPGSIMATRTLNAFISCAKHSLTASRANLEAAKQRGVETELRLSH
jgi:hypothetical protein